MCMVVEYFMTRMLPGYIRKLIYLCARFYYTLRMVYYVEEMFV